MNGKSKDDGEYQIFGAYWTHSVWVERHQIFGWALPNFGRKINYQQIGLSSGNFMDVHHIPDAAIDVIQRGDALKKVSMARTQHTTAYRKQRLHLWIHQIPLNFEELRCNCVKVSSALLYWILNLKWIKETWMCGCVRMNWCFDVLVFLKKKILNESKKCECVAMCMS